jgi:serine protease Do
MKITTILGMCVFFVASLFNHACTINSERETPVVRVVREYAPMVVNIRTETIIDLRESPEWGQYGEELDAFFKEYFGEIYSEGTLKHKSLGSGVILDNTGLIVLKNGTILDAHVVKVNQGDDLAIIKTELPAKVKGVQFADSTDLKIGETVIAIGNPLGLENSVTVGVLSGKDRSFASPECEYACSGLVQTDASINPGNSGGALLNLDGELVGINVAVVPSAQNIGFAIPAVKIQRLLEELE